MAHAIVRRLIDEATIRGCGKISLETTNEFRTIYESLGFREMKDIMDRTLLRHF